ncbi:uncharacterized protein [Argopecten irradians]|uniref:uncharacterized protein n=1 Tax=Argopecten irradians TaxID=31199 RepID=UPI003720D94B
MAPSGQHLFSVAAFLLVFLVKEAECWTSTHSYVTVGGVSVVLIILIVIRICLRTQRCMSSQRRPARQLMVIPGNTQQRVIGTPSNTANPYNAGYDQTGTIGTMGIPPSYVRSVNGSTPDIHPSFRQSSTGSTSGIPPTNGQFVKPTTPGNPSPSDPSKTGYDQPR